MKNSEFAIEPIGWVRSCFSDKFGIPRQPGLVTEAKGEIYFYRPFGDPAAFIGLDSCSHIWVEFLFHQQNSKEFKPRIKAPRLGGNKTLGVFASRSPNRPNKIGLSVVKLDSITQAEGQVILKVSGLDILDKSPVLDIKPYVPYSDKIEASENAIAPAPPQKLGVIFSEQAIRFCSDYERETQSSILQLLEQVLAQDPRPAFQKNQLEREYGISLFDINIKWRVMSRDGKQIVYVSQCEMLNLAPQ